MAESTVRTLVCSVMFLDLVGYSKRPVDEQHRLKRTFNEVLARSLEPVPPRDYIILDTGDGAAIAFLGDPEDALVAGIAVRDSVAALPGKALTVRTGINVGPVKLVWDINAQMNIIGDGINAAQRVMGFAEPGQLLVARSFYEVVSHLSSDYANVFAVLGSRTDKHLREHEVYAVADGARLERSAAGERRRPEQAEPAGRTGGAERRVQEPAKIFDAGEHLIVSGTSRAAVEEALTRLAGIGARIVSEVALTGSKWIATCKHPDAQADTCDVEEAGLLRIVRGPTREAVSREVRELLRFGARLVSDVECHDDTWIAVCDTGGNGR